MTTEIRILDREEDLIAAVNVFRAAMVGFPPMSDLPPGQITKLLDPGRTVGAFVDGQLAGTTDAATSTLTVPGGKAVGHAAVTHVGVLPTFTRRGIATALMQHQLNDIAGRGEAVASLRASEATIYERYGYGVASSAQSVEVATARATFRPGVAAGGPVRLASPAEVWDLLPRIFDANRPSRPGTIDRPAVWWESVRLRTQASSGAWYVAVHGEPGAESGFVRYRPVDTERWFVSDQRTIVVEDFFAPTVDAYLGLLRYLLTLDLIDRVTFWMLPVDDPLPSLLLDRRAVKVTAIRDETWLRVVDAETVLATRSYAGSGTVTVAVNDTLLQKNSAHFAITGDGAERTTRAADLHVGIEGLGAVLLGGTSWRNLAVAGLATAADPEALVMADELFAVPQAPHAGTFF
ncbi:GNAT family acetyltransferase [Mycobacterium sp. 1100029.7]|nr:GNAT family acetyltransferase [Mycobacterium sp. 1100029.7]